jgi:hypothetical protein
MSSAPAQFVTAPALKRGNPGIDACRVLKAFGAERFWPRRQFMSLSALLRRMRRSSIRAWT